MNFVGNRGKFYVLRSLDSPDINCFCCNSTKPFLGYKLMKFINYTVISLLLNDISS